MQCLHQEEVQGEPPSSSLPFTITLHRADILLLTIVDCIQCDALKLGGRCSKCTKDKCACVLVLKSGERFVYDVDSSSPAAAAPLPSVVKRKVAVAPARARQPKRPRIISKVVTLPSENPSADELEVVDNLVNLAYPSPPPSPLSALEFFNTHVKLADDGRRFAVGNSRYTLSS